MKLSYIILSGLFFTTLISCSRGKQFRYEEGIAWNTVYHITYQSEDDLSDSISLVLSEIDMSLSPFNPASTVTLINKNQTGKADFHFKAVYEESRKINEASGGLFDPTLAPIIRAWGFGQGHEVTSDTLRIDSLLQCVGLPRTSLEEYNLIKEAPGIEFNFSAVAKGYGVDCIADMLLRNGVENFLVEVGGEIRAAGHNPKGEKWVIGIDRPSPDSAPGETVLTVSLTDDALATSGNYRNFQESQGNRFGHTISPRTGRPVETDVISASVISKTCMEADALATVCMVAGSKEALDLCSRLGVGVMLIKNDMSVVCNSIWPDAEPETKDRD